MRFGLLLLVFPCLVLVGSAADAADAEPRPVPETLSCPEKAALYAEVYRDELSLPGFGQIAGAVLKKAVEKGRIPGGSVLFERIGKAGAPPIRISALQGTLSVDDRRPVTAETLYDLASLTKVVATATSIMILRDRGLVSLDAPLSRYLPQFANSAFGSSSLGRFLQHRAGLRDVDFPGSTGSPASIKAEYLNRLAKDGAVPNPGQREQFRYTDADYILLGDVVEKVSGLRLDQFARKEIFVPLGMRHTGYLPPAGSVCARALRVCVVHDPLAYAFGGVSGNAGLFSTAEDLGLFARMILNGGEIVSEGARSGRVLISRNSVERMTTDLVHTEDRRGMGFDVDTVYSCAPRGGFLKISFGHTGYTGTSLWLDPVTRSWIVTLTNEADIAKGSIDAIRWALATAAANAVH